MSDHDPQDLAECKVLVVEDHPQSLELLNIYVESLEGVEVLLARDGPSAARMAPCCISVVLS